jgi:hypothetical protein
MKTIATGVLAMLLGAAGCQKGPETAAVEPGSVTVYPVVLGDQPREEVTRFVAVLLERGGLEGIEVSDQAFAPAAGQDFDRAFAEFARKQQLKTDYALYSAYLGKPGRGVDEVRSVLVDGRGAVVWSDRQKPGDEAFDSVKPRNPMGCTMLLMKRLEAPLRLEDPFRKDAPKGKLEVRFQREDGLPDDAERAAMRKRLAAVPAGASAVVYPVRDGESFSKADDLVAAVNAQGLLKARTADKELRFDFKPSMNQQRVLWSAARSLQRLVRANPADADYVLAAHYVRGRMVHVFLLDRQGELVIVDFQNSHQRDFRASRPDTRAACTKLAAVRLASYLK